MKKLLGLTILSILFAFKMVVLNAQTPEPTFINSDRGLQKSEILKLQMKDDLKLFDKRFDSVVAIQKEFLAKIKQVKADKKLTDDIKLKKEKDLVDLKKKRLRAAGLDDAEIKRVEDYYQRR